MSLCVVSCEENTFYNLTYGEEMGDIVIPRPGLQYCWYDFGGLLQLFLDSGINQDVVRAEFLLSGRQNMAVWEFYAEKLYVLSIF